jgi:hypothetical protein
MLKALLVGIHHTMAKVQLAPIGTIQFHEWRIDGRFLKTRSTLYGSACDAKRVFRRNP